MTAAATPLITIVTPAYNQASFLAATIESVLTQDYPRIEHLVLDDGSTDDTASVLARYSGRIRSASHSNMGEARTVNRGFEMAAGEIIAVVNGDDPLLPGAVSTAERFLADRPAALVAYPDWIRIDDQGKTIGEVTVPEYDYAYMLGHHACLPGPGAFFRRRALDFVSGRDTEFRFVGDFDFWLRLGLHGPFARIPKVLATSREHAGAATLGARGVAMANEHVRLIEKFFESPGLPADLRRLHRQAMSWAHFVAAICCGDARWTRLKHSMLFALWHPPSLLEHWGNTRRRTPSGWLSPLHAIRHFLTRPLRDPFKNDRP